MSKICTLDFILLLPLLVFVVINMDQYRIIFKVMFKCSVTAIFSLICKNVFFIVILVSCYIMRASSTPRVTSTLTVPSFLSYQKNFTSKFSLTLSEESDDKFSSTRSLTTKLWFLHFPHSLIMQPPLQECNSTMVTATNVVHDAE